MNFADVLAASIHDIKNALGMVINTLEDITSDPQLGLMHQPKMLKLQLEARQANESLIQLLALYQLDRERLNANIVEHNIGDFFDEMVADHRHLAATRGLVLDYACDALLHAYFDEDLVHGVLSQAIGNAERYARERIRLTAEIIGEYTRLSVEDDGPGFPPRLLALPLDRLEGEGFRRGRTHLGFYFSSQVAALHRNGDRRGEIQLKNGGSLGGACFSILLP